MAVTVFLLVVVAVVARAVSQDLRIPGFTAYNHANPVAESNPLLDAALHTHAEFINFFRFDPVRYNWGYQVTDPTSGEIRSQYESRYGDLAHGSYTVLKTNHTGITLYYSVDDVTRSISGLRVDRSITRLHVPIAPPPKNDNRAAELIEDDPLVVQAARVNDAFLRYHGRIVAPTRYSFEYEVEDPITGDSVSQYQTRYDDIPRGSYTLAKHDGSSRTIYYSTDGLNQLTVDRAEMTEPTVASPTSYTLHTPARTQVYTSLIF